MNKSKDGEPSVDPTSARFWAEANERRLVVQKCRKCAKHQFYPRPFCTACESTSLDWVTVCGTGVIYSMTVTRVQVLPELSPPYVVALVDLDEGPRLLTNIIGGSCKIGDRVRLAWRSREGAPPLPVFELLQSDSEVAAFC